MDGYAYEGLPDEWVPPWSRFFKYHLEWPEFPPGEPPVVVEDGDLVFPDDTHEIFSYADEARSKALGALGIVSAFSEGNIDLNSAYGYDNTRPSHSRQFLSNVVDEDPYWYNLLVNAEMPTSSPR